MKPSETRIIIICDEQVMSLTDSLSQFLSANGYSPLYLGSPDKLCEMLPHFRPHLILIADQPEYCDSVEILHKLQRSPYRMDDSAILSYGFGLSDERITQIVEAGAYDALDLAHLSIVKFALAIKHAVQQQQYKLQHSARGDFQPFISAEPKPESTGSQPITAMIFDYDVEAGRVERSADLYTLTGYTLAESEPTRVWWNRLIHPDDYERMMTEYDRYFQAIPSGFNIHPTEYRLVRKDGRVINVWSQALVMRDEQGEVVRVLGSVMDITDRKAAERATELWQERYNLASAAMKGIIYDYDVLTGRVERSPGVYELTGYTLDEIEPTASWWQSRIYREDLNEMRPSALANYDNPSAEMQQAEYRIYHKDGRVLDVWDRSILVRDETGRVIRMVGTTTDITDRKLAERAEREQRMIAEAMSNIALMLNSTLDLNDVLHLILNTIPQVIPHDAANIMLLHDGVMQLAGMRGYAELEMHDLVNKISQLKTDLNAHPALKTMRDTFAPLVIPDLLQKGDLLIQESPLPLRSYLGMPIVFGNEVLGFLNLNSLQPNFFTEIHAARIKIFAAQAACAIHNAQWVEHAKDFAAVNERQRLARDLHDSISQLLFSASLVSETLLRTAPDHPKFREFQSQVWRLCRAALAEMRKLVVEMRYAESEHFNLPEMLVQLAHAAMGHADVEVRVVVDGKAELPIPVRMTLYRVTQEALNNIIKHANARHADILLRLNDVACELTVRDDGRGFDMGTVNWSSTGLNNIRHRAKSIGGDCDIRSEIGKGTTVTIHWVAQTSPAATR